MTAKKEIVQAPAVADKVIDAEPISEAEYQRIKSLRAAEKADDVPFPIVGVPVIIRITRVDPMQQNKDIDERIRLQRELDAKAVNPWKDDWFARLLSQIAGGK